MTKSLSIVRSVVRAHLLVQLLTAVTIVVVGTFVASFEMIAREDASAVAQAETIGSELENHADDSAAQIDALVRSELEEQRWFSRRVEIYRDGARVGGAGPLLFERFSREPGGCSLASLDGVASRVCIVHGNRNTAFVITSPLGPIVSAVSTIMGALAMTTFGAAIIFAFAGAHVVRRRLVPLSRLESTLTTLPPLGGNRSVEAEWGAEEVDSLARTFNELLARIDKAVEREQRFVADAAHELRQPLTRVRAQIELAIAEIQDGNSAEKRLEAAAKNCAELSRTTEALLAMARDSVAIEEVVNIADVAREHFERLDAPVASRVHVEADDEVLVRGDEALLSLALRNLVDNAINYSSGEVTIRVAVVEGNASVLVADHGPGISEQELPRVVEPFVRGNGTTQRIRGSGLGLALTRHVALLHGGSLKLRNRKGGGLDAELRVAAWQQIAR